MAVAVGTWGGLWLLAVGLRAKHRTAYAVADLVGYDLVGMIVAALAIALVTAFGFRVVPRLAAALLIASPVVALPAYVALRAAARYHTGTAALHRGLNIGMSGGWLHDYGGIDAATRYPLHFVTTGCGGLPLQTAMEVGVHNGVLRTLTTVFGPMPGSYRGPLPDAATVLNHVTYKGTCMAGDRPSRALANAEVPAPWYPTSPGPMRVALLDDGLAAGRQCFVDTQTHRPAGCVTRIVDLQRGRLLGVERSHDGTSMTASEITPPTEVLQRHELALDDSCDAYLAGL